VTLRDYHDGDRARVTALFDDFQAYLVSLDPLHRLRHVPGCGAKMLNATRKEVREQRGIFVVALDASVIIGFVAGILQERKDRLDVIDSLGGRVTELYVDAAFRGQGIGTQLMRHIEEWFRASGCDVVQIEVFVPNRPARRLYEKFGYAHRDIDTMKRL
jgi:ribosomal protein S18 acetylase RimI-like enzyme